MGAFFTESDEQVIVSAIIEAEKKTSGEIRVHVDKKCGDDPMQACRNAFEKLGMRNTEQHNGVLFYFAADDKKFVVLGDDGINEKVPENFWDSVRDVMQEHFRNGDFTAGLSHGILEAGKQLAEFFPYQRDDINELPDSVSYGEGFHE